ncbi:MAG: radical SAM/SPASM domain-containing protein [bacterium]
MARGVNRKLLQLPPGFICFMIRQMRHEKFTLHNNRVFINSMYTPFPSRSYKTALESFRNLSKGIMSPFSCYISVTDRCPLRCLYCSNARKEQTDGLPAEEICRIIRQIQDAGVSCIGFTGGEPLLRDDLEPLLRMVDDRSYTILFTSGHGLDRSRARTLEQAGLTIMVISLDSQEHNRMRRSESAFDDAIAAIEHALAAGIYTAVSTVMTKQMLHSEKMDEFVRFAAGLGIHEIRLLEPKPCGRLLYGDEEMFGEEDRDRMRQIQYAINRDISLPAIMSFAHITAQGNYGCSAGRVHVYVNAQGEVCPCDFSPFSFGNLCNESFNTIYARMNRYLPRPFSGCIISSVAGRMREMGIDRLPVRDMQVIDQLLDSMEKGPVPLLYTKLGFGDG